MLDLTLTLDEFMIKRGYRLTDLKFDEISSSIAAGFRIQMSRPKQLTAPKTRIVEAFNHTTRQKEGRLITTQIHRDPELNVNKVGSISVAGKSEPLIFVVDTIANSLLYHLNKLPSDAPLNRPLTTQGWELDQITFHVQGEGPSMLDLF